MLVAADLVGIAREALTRTVAYDRERKQFGVPVGSFQSIKHTLADLHWTSPWPSTPRSTPRTPSRWGPRTPRWRSPSPRPRRATRRVASTAAMIQYHGGIGYTWEHEAHLFYKRAKRLAGPVGRRRTHRARIAELTMGG